MMIPTLGRQNVTPKVDHFSGILEPVTLEGLASNKSQRNVPTVLYITGNSFNIPRLLTALPSGIEGVIFQEGTPFYHPAIYLAAEGIPCAIRPEKDLSNLAGHKVFVDMKDGQVKTDGDIPEHKPIDRESFYRSLDPSDYTTVTPVNVCLRTHKELNHVEQLRKAGITAPHIVLFLEPAFYELGEDPYILAKENPKALAELMKSYLTRAIGLADKGVYIRTPEVSAHERGSSEPGTEALTELRGIPYDVHRDPSLIKVMFDMMRDVASDPQYRGKAHLILAMPRSSEDLKYSRALFEQSLDGSGLQLGTDINFTAFAETPYWLIPSRHLDPDVKALCGEPNKEDYLADKNGKLLWGSGDLGCCFMAASRDLSSMSGYLGIKAEEINAMRQSVKAWNQAGFVPDLCGSMFWAPFSTEAKNIEFYRVMQGGKQEYTVTAQRFLDVKRILHQVEHS